MLPCRHNYVPYIEAAQVPHIVVDGSSSDHCALALSHWPRSGTPWPLKADTSAEIVFNYLNQPAFHQNVPTVTNNHFDEDGLLGLYCLIEPEHALKRQALLIDVSKAGDFGTYESREAARIAFAISRLANRELSPWGANCFPVDYPDYCAFTYRRLLDRLGALIENVDAYRELWAEEDMLLEFSERAFATGDVTLEEHGDIDLAIVQVPAEGPYRREDFFAMEHGVALHRMAVFNRTPCNRIVILCGDRISFSYRYESWVQLVSHRPPGRIDLTPLATDLSQEEGAAWRFGGVDAITPGLRPSRNYTSIRHGRFLEMLATALRNGDEAWDPYDPTDNGTRF